MFRNADVSSMMDEVSRTLRRAHRSSRFGVLFVNGPPTDPYGFDRVRGRSHVTVDLPSGSARPVVGPMIAFTKRVFRRGVRWYAQPVATQQTEVNLGLLDAADKMAMDLERLRVRLVELETKVEELEDAVSGAPGAAARSRTSSAGDELASSDVRGHGVEVDA